MGQINKSTRSSRDAEKNRRQRRWILFKSWERWSSSLHQKRRFDLLFSKVHCEHSFVSEQIHLIKKKFEEKIWKKCRFSPCDWSIWRFISSEISIAYYVIDCDHSLPVLWEKPFRKDLSLFIRHCRDDSNPRSGRTNAQTRSFLWLVEISFSIRRVSIFVSLELGSRETEMIFSLSNRGSVDQQTRECLCPVRWCLSSKDCEIGKFLGRLFGVSLIWTTFWQGFRKDQHPEKARGLWWKGSLVSDRWCSALLDSDWLMSLAWKKRPTREEI